MFEPIIKIGLNLSNSPQIPNIFAPSQPAQRSSTSPSIADPSAGPLLHRDRGRRSAGDGSAGTLRSRGSDGGHQILGDGGPRVLPYTVVDIRWIYWEIIPKNGKNHGLDLVDILEN